MQNAQGLRSSFQQLVVGHQVQRPQANRNFRRGRQQQRGGWAPSQGPVSHPAGWPLSAVRADQATDAADTEAIQLISDITRAVDEVHAAALQRNAAAALEGLLAGSTSELKQKVQASILDLQSGLLERETEVRRGTVGCGASVLCCGGRLAAAAVAGSAHYVEAAALSDLHLQFALRRCACCCWRRCVASTCCSWAPPAPPSLSSLAA